MTPVTHDAPRGPLLELRGLTRRFGERLAVDAVSLDVKAGEFLTLLGPSGCGKTTLLRLIAGLDRPDTGQVRLDGRDITSLPPEKRPLHTVFQSYALFPHLTVGENVAFPLRMAGVPAPELRARVAGALADVRLAERADAYPHELSGGQRQRVALARALVGRPRLVLLDEPLAALDAKLREAMQRELIDLQREVGITFVYVTHAQDEALALSHRIAVLDRGRIEQIDTPARIYEFPRNRFVADFIGNINLFEVEVAAAHADGLRLLCPPLGTIVARARPGVRAGQRGWLAIRPEQLRLLGQGAATPADNRFAGVVRDAIYVGNVTTYTVELAPAVTVEALLPNTQPGRAMAFAAGAPVVVAWSGDVGVFLDA